MKFILKVYLLWICALLIHSVSCTKEKQAPWTLSPQQLDLPTGVGVDTIIRTDSVVIYEFYLVQQGPVFEEMDAYWRLSTVTLKEKSSINQTTVKVFVKWNNTMIWEAMPVCGVSCLIIDRFCTVGSNFVNVYLRSDPYYATGKAEETIHIKVVL